MKNDHWIKLLVFVVVGIGLIYITSHLRSAKLPYSEKSFVRNSFPLSDSHLGNSQQRNLSSLPMPFNSSSPANVVESNLEKQKVEAIIAALSQKKGGNIPVNRSESTLGFIDRVLRDPDKRSLEQSLKQSSRSYRTLPGIKAILSDRIPHEVSTESRLLSFLNYTLVRTGEVDLGNLAFPVVYDTQRGTLGIVTGTLTVSYRGSSSGLTEIPAGLKMIQNFPQLEMATFVSATNEFESLIKAVQSLKSNPRVQDVTVNITESRLVIK